MAPRIDEHQEMRDRMRVNNVRRRVIRNNHELIRKSRENIAREIDRFGQSRMSRALGVAKVGIFRWKTEGVPPAHVPEVSVLLQRPYHDIRPDIFPYKKKFGYDPEDC